MKILLWASLPWVFYQCWCRMDWYSVQQTLSLPDVDRVFLLNSAKILMRLFCFLYIIWQVICYYRVRMQYKVLLGRVTYFMTFYKIPDHIQDRVLQYYQQAWENKQLKFPVSRIFLKLLPNELFNTLTEHVGITVLEKLQMYQECFRFFVCIAPKVKTLYYLPGEYVCRKGTYANNMYLVCDGILEATTESGQHLDTMSAGDVVGEIGVLHIDGNYTRTANVRSVGDSEVLVLKEKDVNDIIKEFPEARAMLMSLGTKRLLRSRALPTTD